MMQTTLGIHILSALAIAVFATASLILPLEKDHTVILTSRIIYLPLFITGLILAFRTVHTQPVMTILKIAIVLAFVALLEITLANKLKRRPGIIFLTLIAVLFFLAALFGIILFFN
ncbi:DUF1516 family protein [Oenococcus sp.]|uniref:DUF1516 family protein n=1 Tax=Oenococcus sp. TaxID=1979414 RepID=UPI0039EC7ADB